MKTKIYISEEQEEFREQFRISLSSKSDVELIGLCGIKGLNQLGQTISEFNPDVLLIGVKTLTDDIVNKILEACKENRHTGIILLAMNFSIADIDSLHQYISSHHDGGFAFFSKQSLEAINHLSNIVYIVHHGEVILDHQVTACLEGNTAIDMFKGLTSRELETLSLLSAGYSNLAIAGAMSIDVKTVKRYINSMYSKLGLGENLKEIHPRVSAVIIFLESKGKFNVAGSKNH